MHASRSDDGSSRFASTPEAPYYAVIFSNQRTSGENGYGAMADRMVELAAEQPGYLGVESTRDGSSCESRSTSSMWRGSMVTYRRISRS